MKVHCKVVLDVRICCSSIAVVTKVSVCVSTHNRKAYQAIDIGAFDLDNEWFLRKEVELVSALEYTSVNIGKKCREIHQFKGPRISKMNHKEDSSTV